MLRRGIDIRMAKDVCRYRNHYESLYPCGASHIRSEQSQESVTWTYYIRYAMHLELTENLFARGGGIWCIYTDLNN